jgi:transcriptional regulator with XRE-family HTH domain
MDCVKNTAFTTQIFPAVLAEKMTSAGINAAQLADRSGLEIHKIETALGGASGALELADLAAIAEALGLPLWQLLASRPRSITL